MLGCSGDAGGCAAGGVGASESGFRGTGSGSGVGRLSARELSGSDRCGGETAGNTFVCGRGVCSSVAQSRSASRGDLLLPSPARAKAHCRLQHMPFPLSGRLLWQTIHFAVAVRTGLRRRFFRSGALGVFGTRLFDGGVTGEEPVMMRWMREEGSGEERRGELRV